MDFTSLDDPVNVAVWMQQQTVGDVLHFARGVADELVSQVPVHTLSLRGKAKLVEAFALTA